MLVVGNWLSVDNVEADGLGEWAALTDGNDITLVETEAWAQVSWDVLVSLFISLVLWNIVQVVTADDDATSHLVSTNDTTEDSATDTDITGEWALVVDVGTFDGLLRDFEAKTNVAGETLADLAVLVLGVADLALLLVVWSYKVSFHQKKWCGSLRN